MKLIIIIQLIFISCTVKNSNSVSNVVKMDSNALETNKNFLNYCIDLGIAMKNNDRIVLERLIDVNVEVSGREDLDPFFLYTGETRINKSREFFLSGGVYDHEKDLMIPYTQLFSDSNMIKEFYKPEDSIQDIEDFYFISENRKNWKLKGFFTNTKSWKK